MRPAATAALVCAVLVSFGLAADAAVAAGDEDLYAAASAGDSTAQWKLGASMLTQGRYEEAKAWYEASSAQGDAQAQWRLGEL